MVDKVISNNVVTVVGIVKDNPVFSHEMYGEDFYNVFNCAPFERGIRCAASYYF